MRWTLIVFLFALLLSCQSSETQDPSGARVLARVQSKTLYLSDLEGMIPTATSAEDSAQIIRAYVERWVRDAVMMLEAEKNVPKDLNIDKLVRDYRASLIMHNYEKILVEELLDSTVTGRELRDFYDQNKDQFSLDEDIVRCHFLKISKSAPDLKKVQGWWKSDKSADQLQLRDYAANYAAIRLMEDSSWYNLGVLSIEWPGGLTAGQLPAPGQTISKSDKDFVYYFRLLELVRKNGQPPLGYVADQAKKVILHKRKMQLLSETKERIYEKALRQKEVEIFQ